MPSSSKPDRAPDHMLIFPDEFHMYSPFADDPLKEALRELPNVPNATYVVGDDGLVFVFRKLVDLVKAQEFYPAGDYLATVPELLPLARITTQEAVERWGIVPEPYEVITQKDGSFQIRHQPFDALLPGQFATQAEMHAALIALLEGKVVDGPGSFFDGAQPLVGHRFVEVATMPANPDVGVPLSRGTPSFWHLSCVPYKGELTALPLELFSKFAAQYDEWLDIRSVAHNVARQEAHTLWKRHHLLCLESLRDERDKLPEDDAEGLAQQDSKELMKLYPELSNLGEASLYQLFAEYAWNKSFRSWTPAREDDFLFFLMGRVMHANTPTVAAAIEAGLFAAHSLLRPKEGEDPLMSAYHRGLLAAEHHQKINAVAGWVRNAVRYAGKQPPASVRRGGEVTTGMDLFRLGRTQRN